METVNGRNFIGRSNSDFSAGHRIFTYLSKKFEYAKKTLATTITLAYTGQSGSPISFTYAGSPVRDVNTGETNDLLFIPTQAQLAGMPFAIKHCCWCNVFCSATKRCVRSIYSV